MRGQSNMGYKISLNFKLQKILKFDKTFLHGIVDSSEMCHLSEYGRHYSNLEREVKISISSKNKNRNKTIFFKLFVSLERQFL